MYERGYKFSSVEEKQVVGRADITTKKQTAFPAAVHSGSRDGYLQAKTKTLRLRYYMS